MLPKCFVRISVHMNSSLLSWKEQRWLIISNLCLISVSLASFLQNWKFYLLLNLTSLTSNRLIKYYTAFLVSFNYGCVSKLWALHELTHSTHQNYPICLNGIVSAEHDFALLMGSLRFIFKWLTLWLNGHFLLALTLILFLHKSIYQGS